MWSLAQVIPNPTLSRLGFCKYLKEIGILAETSKVVHVDYPLFSMIPLDTLKFYEKFSIDDHWNQFIFQEVARAQGLRLNTLLVTHIVPEESRVNSAKIKRSALKYFGKFLLNYVGRMLNRRHLLISTYLSPLTLIPLSWRLKTIPSFVQQSSPCGGGLDRTYRLRAVNQQLPSKFEEFAMSQVLLQIPKVFLEGYKDLVSQAKSCPWPNAPENVVTAIRHFYDDVFKCYVAIKSEFGCKRKIICHGGGGKMEYSDWQSMDFRLSDQYYTWGWKDYSSKCYQGTFIRTQISPQRPGSAKKKQLLTYIVLSQHRYAQYIDSCPSYEQYLNIYLHEQLEFLNTVPENIAKHLEVKLSENRDSFLYRALSKSSNKGLKFRFAETDFYSLLKNTRILVSTYNGTTLVEGLSLDIPTVIFWNPALFELTAIAQQHFENLSRVDIFHNNPRSARDHIISIWDDPDTWWNSPDVKQVRKEFVDWFGRKSIDPARDIEKFIVS
jgi:putative transferase (TIGR04331 family)